MIDLPYDALTCVFSSGIERAGMNGQRYGVHIIDGLRKGLLASDAHRVTLLANQSGYTLW